jgi:nicotinamide-nucleotide amidase
MKIGFLVIGSEVLDGKISDLNTKYLADFLRQNNLEINESTTVRDDADSIKAGLYKLFTKNEVVITSGGLGPTKDDITKETIGDFFHKKMILNQEAIKIAENNYKQFDRIFPGKEHGYAYLPEGFSPLSNSTGFAPGFYFKEQNKILFSCPGVPREFNSMLNDHFFKISAEKIDHKIQMRHFVVRTKNVPEEKIFGEVDPTLWEKLQQFGDVSSLPILMGVDIGIKIKASSKEALEKQEIELRSIFASSPISKSIWHIGAESLEQKIVSVANEKKITFGFAESATGGLCSHRITSISGSSQSFLGSVICYDERVKINQLGVKPETIEKFQVVSPETAIEMAQGLQKSLNLDLAISITGYAGPTGGTKGFPVGSVCIGRAMKDGHSSASIFNFKGDREILKQRFSQAALYALLEELEKIAGI